MLVLTRKVNQQIVIGDVVVTITWIGATKVRVGIEAPSDVAIIRRELQDGKEGRSAAA